MATRKPDWAQRAVEKLLNDCTALPETNGWIAIKRHDLESLLRAHHRKVKRMVQALQQPKHGLCGYTLAQVLAKMKELER